MTGDTDKPPMNEKRDIPGAFEQLVLLALLRLAPDAYGMTVRKEIEAQTRQPVSLGAVYATLERLETKGYVRSTQAPGGRERGGRARRFFEVEAAGLRALRRALETTDRMRRGLGVLCPEEV